MPAAELQNSTHIRDDNISVLIFEATVLHPHYFSITVTPYYTVVVVVPMNMNIDIIVDENQKQETPQRSFVPILN